MYQNTTGTPVAVGNPPAATLALIKAVLAPDPVTKLPTGNYQGFSDAAICNDPSAGLNFLPVTRPNHRPATVKADAFTATQLGDFAAAVQSYIDGLPTGDARIAVYTQRLSVIMGLSQSASIPVTHPLITSLLAKMVSDTTITGPQRGALLLVKDTNWTATVNTDTWAGVNAQGWLVASDIAAARNS